MIQCQEGAKETVSKSQRECGKTHQTAVRGSNDSCNHREEGVERRGAQDSAKKVFGIDLFCQKKRCAD